MESRTTWSELVAIVEANRTFLLSSHMSLDGDCAGSQLAMHWYLTSRGKSCTIYNCDPVPPKFSFLQSTDLITNVKPTVPVDVLMVLDASNPDRLGWQGVLASAKTTVNIDHHRDNSLFAHFNHVDPSASATAELIYAFFADQGIDYPAHVAEYLYTAILTDTGGFRFSNTNGRVLKVCGDLADRGVDCSKVYRRAYELYPPEGLMLRSRIIATMKYHLGGRLCTLELPLALVDELGATYSDAEGIVDFTVLSTGVEVGMFIKYKPGETHFSLRSRGSVDVGRIAQKIPGGGGHGSAAGCTINASFEQAFPTMLDFIRAELG